MKKYLRPEDLAQRWAMTTKTLAGWRYRGTGPAYIKIGGLVRYAVADLETYETVGRVEAVAG